MIFQERPHYMKELPDDRLLTIKYNFESLLYEAENYRYKQSTLGRIMLQDEQGNDLEEIGRLYIDKLLFGEGSNNDWGMFEIFDTEQYLMDLGCLIWDLEVNDYVEPLNKFFEYDIHQIDMLYVHTFEVLPAYRGMQIGEHALKDAYNNLSQGCGLMVVDCVPIQHTTWGAKDEEWHKKMRYELFEPDKEKAKDRLVQYLKRTGFYYLPEVSKDHMFLSTARRNNNFDYIELT